MEFRLGSIPVLVRGQFLLTALFLGMDEREPMKMAIWVAVVFVSVLVHELGHALIGKAFGLTPAIVLHGMGGHTMMGDQRADLGRWRRIAISLAGPFAGFFLAGGVFVALVAVPTAPPLVRLVLQRLLEVNIGWGIFNLLPMMPLDGGNVMRALIGRETPARVVSIVFAVGIGLLALKSRGWWLLFLSVLFAFQNVQALRHAKAQGVDRPLVDALERGHAALERKDYGTAIALLAPVVTAPASPEVHASAVRLYLVALFSEGEWRPAMEVIEREQRALPAEHLDEYARALRVLGQDTEAQRVDALRQAPAPLSDFRA